MDIEFLARIVGPDLARTGRRVEPVGRRSDGGMARAAADGRGAAPGSPGGLVVELSAAARARAEAAPSVARPVASRGGVEASSRGDQSERIGELSDEEQEEVERLRRRDAEVRAHENAHKAAAGQHARGGPRYEFERGPDGRRYAVGGEVKIDTAAVPDDPDATIRKMRQVRRAALAPAEPSPQDRRVAAEASAKETAARAEKQQAKRGGDEASRLEGGRRRYEGEAGPRRSGFDVVV